MKTNKLFLSLPYTIIITLLFTNFCMKSMDFHCKPLKIIQKSQQNRYELQRRRACTLDAPTQIHLDTLKIKITLLRKKYEALHNQCRAKQELRICKLEQCEKCIQYLNNRATLMDQISHLKNQLIILQSPSHNSEELVTSEDFI